MYIYNGYVCGGKPSETLKITRVKPLDDMIMLLDFSSGETRVFDATVLDGPVFRPLSNPEVFSNPVIDHGVVTWQDGEIDCAPEFMYEHSYEYMKQAV